MSFHKQTAELGLRFTDTMQAVDMNDMWEREKRKKFVEALRTAESMVDSMPEALLNLRIAWEPTGEYEGHWNVMLISGGA